MNIKLIVTGTGRCGTTYLAKLLTSMGFLCGHESIFNYDDEKIIKNRLIGIEKPVLSSCSQKESPNWINPLSIKGDSSYLAAPYLDWKELIKTKIIHLKRDPIKTVNSFLIKLRYFEKESPNSKNIFNIKKWENKIWDVLPELYSIKNSVERVCYFYVKWNQIIEEKTKEKNKIKINIEDNNINEKIIKFIGIKPGKKIFCNKKENSFNMNVKYTINLSSIPNGAIKKDFIKECKKYYKI